MTPVIGINPFSNCQSNLTHPVEYSEDVESAFEKLFAGAYKLIMRSRIRTVMYGKGLYSRPFYINQKYRTQGERRMEYVLHFIN